MSKDYRDTILLPKSDFPQRAGLPTKEPLILERWEKMDLYQKQRDTAKGKEKFILHMGPPFANGHIHVGHVLTTVLKDVVTKSYQMSGYDAPLVPGFDCHGLPIEWKIEEKYRNAGKDKEDVPPEQFREECRQFADHWVGVQTSEFKRLGIVGDWKDPYLTMTNGAESRITKEIFKFMNNDSLYRGSKPVMWSIPEKTALAEAEVEYRDHVSDTVWLKFPIVKGPEELIGTNIVIWTTTPWTMPGNRMVAYGEKISYKALEVVATEEEAFVQPGDKLLVCDDLYEDIKTNAKITEDKVFWTGEGKAFDGVICHHPLHDGGYDFDVPALAGDFVTTETGTGFVHCAPGHGEDDYKLGLEHNIKIPHTVDEAGYYTNEVPMFEGAQVYTEKGKKGDANGRVIKAMIEAGKLVAKGRIEHSYPHSWRSKAPVIFRNTPQWFISMDKNGLRDKALEEIRKTRWVPGTGENRIHGMVEGRGDWCISRQRAWGVPIAIFVNKESGELLNDEEVQNRTLDIFDAEGSDAWFTRPAEDFLGNNYSTDDYEQIKDIIDVWFESGSTQGFVLEERPELQWPADIYLEGSDQHRGWFQSSLLVGCGTRGGAPFKTVLTHGFILDQKGHKMSKSGSNALSPEKLMQQYGADILRLWSVTSDYIHDVKMGEDVIKGNVDIYRRIRNCFCYMLGNLGDYNPETDRVPFDQLSELDRWVLHRLSELEQAVCNGNENFEFLKMVNALHEFCANDLSAFYFDINKDNLYCNAQNDPKRRAAQTVLEQVFIYLCHWLAPVLSFTAEEAWLAWNGKTLDDLDESIHLRTYPDLPAEWKNPGLKEKFGNIMNVRRVINGAIEPLRKEKVLGSSLQAKPTVHITDPTLKALIEKQDMMEIAITSVVTLTDSPAPADATTVQDIENVAVTVETTEGAKCERCWRYTEDIGSNPAHEDLCARCAGVVGDLPEKAVDVA